MALTSGVLVASLAVPLDAWRTGRAPVEPLALVQGGPPIERPHRVWIDTDAACGAGARTDPDDCLALLLLARAPGIEVVGVSSVHGNASLAVTDVVTRELVERTQWPRPRPRVQRGAASPLRAGEHAAPTRASEALRAALRQGPLTVLALGPLTNVATALEKDSTLHRNLGRLVVVAGRRPGHLFHPAEGAGRGILFGHGPVFRDFNFAADPEAATRIVRMGVPTSLVPYDAATSVVFTAADLAAIAAQGGAADWVARRAQGWLAFWRDDVGIGGFYPFDLLAAAYVLWPHRFDCAEADAWVADDDRLWRWFYAPRALMVGTPAERPAAPAAAARLLYCPRAGQGLHDELVAALSAAP